MFYKTHNFHSLYTTYICIYKSMCTKGTLRFLSIFFKKTNDKRKCIWHSAWTGLTSLLIRHAAQGRPGYHGKDSRARGHGFLSRPHSLAPSCSHFLLKGSMEAPGPPPPRGANLFRKLARGSLTPSFPKARGITPNLVFGSWASEKRGSIIEFTWLMMIKSLPFIHHIMFSID